MKWYLAKEALEYVGANGRMVKAAAGDPICIYRRDDEKKLLLLGKIRDIYSDDLAPSNMTTKTIIEGPKLATEKVLNKLNRKRGE